MNWGRSIILTFILFAVFIFSLAAVCMRQDINLVSPTYYKEELNYQQQINRLDNANALAIRPSVELVGDEMVMTYTDLDKVDSGSVKLFRPSNEKFDREFRFVGGAGNTREMKVGSLLPGLYRVRITWSMRNKEYFLENVIAL
ncbi:MAG TPA: FixH family protein [Cyclobacteriaceae bacterium]|nr:FixH family protein [Cyclobacteriaceae bacterium]